MRICSIDGCNNKHKGRGYCNLHYQRWRGKFNPVECSVDDCPNKHFSKGYCRKHHYSFLRYGNPNEARRYYRVRPDGTKQCAKCHELKPIIDLTKHGSYCLQCVRTQSKNSYHVDILASRRRQRQKRARLRAENPERYFLLISEENARRRSNKAAWQRQNGSPWTEQRKTRENFLQQQTKQQASMHLKNWTEEDMYIIYNETLSGVQKALILNRSYKAIKSAHYRFKDRNPYVN